MTGADQPPKKLQDLAAWHPPRPIQDQADYDNAIEAVAALIAVPRPTRPQRDYLETLTILVEAYEKKHHAINTSKVRGLDAMKFLLDENDMTGSDLGRLLGKRQIGWAILNGKRELSKAHIRKLADRFKVDPGLFL